MDPERWKRIDEIFHAALQRESSARQTYLAEACEGDELLRSEIEGLLASHEKESTFFKSPPADLAAELLSKQDPYKGSIAHYKILKKIGSGGMGDVYLAEDPRLNRKVAIKLLPKEFATDKERIRRFEREARALSALNHPYILTVYDIGQVDSSTFIASEYIDGETLRQRIRASKMPLKEILTIVIQVAEALEAAHRVGIIHRDIKPENIMLRHDGYVKVLDFGLSKSIEKESTSTSEASDLETISRTQKGVVLGTVRYMSPEQARGLKVDSRTDIFSLGIVFYEMIARRVPFDGATSNDVLAAILQKNPSALSTYGEFPEQLEWILSKALAKEPEERYQTAKDLLTDLKRIRKQLELEEALKRSDHSATAKAAIESKTGFRTNLFKFLIAASLLVVAVAAFKFISKRDSTLTKSKTLNQRQITFSGMASSPEISPDGKFLAYYESPDKIFVQSLDGGNPFLVTNPTKLLSGLRWSPDGAYLLFAARPKDRIEGFAVSPFGGQPRPIPVFGYLVCWSPDGTRVASTDQVTRKIAIWSIDQSGRTIVNFHLPIEYLFLVDFDWTIDRFAVLVLTETKSIIVTFREDGSQPEIVLTEEKNSIGGIRWSWDSNAIYYWKYGKSHQSDLMKLKISLDSGKAIGNPQPVLTDLADASGLSFSRNGFFAYNHHSDKSNIWTSQLDNSKQEWSHKRLTQGTWQAYSPSISQDATTVAFALARGENASIFTLPVSGGEMRQLTFQEDSCISTAWSPSGKNVAAVCEHGDGLNVVLINAEEGIQNRFKLANVSYSTLLSWAPGNSILYQVSGNRNFNFLDPNTGVQTPLLKDTSRGWIFNALISPDQKLATFATNWPRANSGIWIENLSNHTGTLLSPLNRKEGVHPFAWSSDSKWVYIRQPADIENGVIISKINIDSKKEIRLPRLHLGEDQEIQQLSLAQDEKTFAAAVSEAESDVWIVENFDPDAIKQK